ncbi:cytochrome c3 family protein [Bacteroidota bacterium]
MNRTGNNRTTIFTLLSPFLLSFLFITGSPAQPNEDCMMCHEDPDLTAERDGRQVSMFVSQDILGRSVHGPVTCISCHPGAAGEDFPHAENLPAVSCGNCHTEPDERFMAGIHGQAMQLQDPHAPDCKECHGAHNILHNSDPQSITYKTNIPILCGTCHKEGAPVSRSYEVSEHNIVENYTQGIHGEGLFNKGLIVTATCNNCHGNHLVLPHTSPNSSVSPVNIARTCIKCHTKIEEVHKKVIRGELWEKQPDAVPACNSCHPPHRENVKYVEANIADQICMNCHEKEDVHKMVDGERVSMRVLSGDLPGSVHKNIACAKCHTDVTPGLKRPCSTSSIVDCSNCHAEVSESYIESGHGKSFYGGSKNAPYCTDCHGTHKTKSRYDDTSPTYRTLIPGLCGTCHKNEGKANLEVELKEINAYRDYSMSVHGKGLVEKGLSVSAVCTDCHTTHFMLKEEDIRSSVHPDNVPQTCATCHKGIYDEYIQSDHSITRAGLVDSLPTCVNCHSAHVISASDKDKFMTEITVQCGSCHKKLSETYMDTYHGKAYQLGYLEAARCSDCHGAHNVLRADNPNSTVGILNIVSTCAKCHKNANSKFTKYLNHATHHDDPALNFTYWAMTSLLLGVFGFFGIHILLWLPRSISERKKHRHVQPKGPTLYFRRFTRSHRITHIFVILSFILLALTGMMLKFAHMDWAKSLSWIFGGVEGAGKIHRIGAILTFGYFAYHIYALFKMRRRRKKSYREYFFGRNSLMFNKQDIKDIGATLKWFVGRGPRPDYGRWTYWEKFDYMAVFWGVAVIGFSGLVLWFPTYFTQVFPGWVINISQIIHSDEALLAVVFIFTVHFFNTHFRPEAFPMDTVIFTGHQPLETFKRERHREYEELKKSGKLDKLVSKKEYSKDTMRIIRFFGFLFLTIGFTLVGLIIYSFITG